MNGLLLLALISTLCGHLASAAWSQTHRDQILKIHNDYRAGVPNACNLGDLTYDMEIENAARRWANRCVFAHEMRGYGENIAYYPKVSGTFPGLITKMAKMWYDEVRTYRYGQYGCGSSCHYTQVVWANTKRVGCYAADCSNLGGGSYFLVCYYTPQGNYQDQQPYKVQCDGTETNGKTGSVSTARPTNNRWTTASPTNNRWTTKRVSTGGRWTWNTASRRWVWTTGNNNNGWTWSNGAWRRTGTNNGWTWSG